jgi:hypothetical protein
VLFSFGRRVNLPSQYEELPHYRGIIVLISLTEPSVFSWKDFGTFVVGVERPLVNQADILPEHVGRMAIESSGDQGSVLERRCREVGDDKLQQFFRKGRELHAMVSTVWKVVCSVCMQ